MLMIPVAWLDIATAPPGYGSAGVSYRVNVLGGGFNGAVVMQKPKHSQVLHADFQPCCWPIRHEVMFDNLRLCGRIVRGRGRGRCTITLYGYGHR